jgi:hypothetical protein
VCDHTCVSWYDSSPPEIVADRSAAELEELFAGGTAPSPLPDGRLQGGLLTLTPPLAAPLANGLAAFWQPWLGKRFVPAEARGTNLLERSSFEAMRIFAGGGRWFRWWPEDEGAYQAFPFTLSVTGGELRRVQDVVRIDYDRPENSPLVRRIVDEAVEVEPGVLLGQALVGVAGRKRRAAWFALW